MEKIKKVDEAIKYLDSIDHAYRVYDYTSSYVNPNRTVRFRGVVVQVNWVDIMDGGPEKQKPMINTLGDLLSTIDFRSMSCPGRIPGPNDENIRVSNHFTFGLQEIVEEKIYGDDDTYTKEVKNEK